MGDAYQILTCAPVPDDPWQRSGGADALVLPVSTLHHHYGCLYVLVDRRGDVEPYVPFVGNFAAELALTLDNKRQQSELATANEQLQESQMEYGLLFSRMTNGFAVHEIITDETGKAVDYRFLDANEAFEQLTGLSRSDILGRTVLEVIPDLEPSWIERYGEVALTGRQIQFESAAESLGKYYMVVAYSPSPGRFATVFSDITERKRREEILGKAASEAEAAYEREHELAEQLQKLLLPAVPQVRGLEIDAVYEAASDVARVGGDFYDLAELPDGRIMLAVGDACGKGIRATRRMAMTRFTLRAFASAGLEAGEWLREVNRAVHSDLDGDESDFVTVALVLLDRQHRRVEYAIAGHPRPYAIDGSGARELYQDPALPLGVDAGARFATSVDRLDPEGVLLLFTDGLSEAMNDDHRLFWDELPSALAGAAAQPVAGEAARLVDQARRFAGGHLRDDTAVVLVRIP